ncbi:MAG: AAA family ATPase, partial [Cetobacterium sp.]
MVKKKLPVGIDDFKKIIENDYYFADKTMFIDELLNKKSEVTLLPRPRRFGKTLNMSMLNYFFNIEEKEINKELFNGL